MEPFLIENQQYLQLEKWQQQIPQLVTGFTTKQGGVSKGAFSSFNLGLHVHDEKTAVLKNREMLAKQIGFSLDDWVAGEQMHDIKIKMVSKEDKGSGATTTASACKGMDGLITTEKGLLLTAFFADCIPLYFIDPEKEMIGIAHAGWKGTVGGIAQEMVLAFKKHGSEIENILITIGPGISEQHYEVDRRVADAIDKKFQNKVLIEKKNNQFLLDLKALNREILLNCGVLRHNIDMTNYCTYRDKSLFFSYRRDQGKTGRMLGFIGFRE